MPIIVRMGSTPAEEAPTLDGDATEADVLPNKTFYSNSTTKKTGNMEIKTVSA